MNIKCSNKAKASDGAHLLIFLAWLLYTVSYLGKLNYSANITQIVDYYQISKAQAGIVPSFFFFAYGIGQVVNGLLCKKYNIKWMIFLSLFVSAVINLIVALTPDFEIIKWLWMINGFMLSILWPTLVRLLTGALPQKDLGKSSVIMGTTVAVGTLVIYGLSSVFAIFDMFKLSFYTASFLELIVAVLWLFLYGKAFKSACEEKAKEVISHNNEAKKEKSFENGKAEKNIIYITICVLCLYAVIVNLTKDGLTTWVPSILKENFEMSDSVSILLTLTLPIVAIFGNLVALKTHKFLPDYITHCFVVFIIIGVIVGVIIAGISRTQIIFTLVGLMFVNFMASSLNSLITSIFPMFMREKVNSGLFAGILNGFCYVGSTISSYGLGLIADNFSWISVFWLLIGCCLFAGIVWCIYIGIRYILCVRERRTLTKEHSNCNIYVCDESNSPRL